MRPFIIDKQLSDRLDAVRHYAETHMQRADDPEYRVPGDNPRHVVLTDFGYRIVYSQDFFPGLGTVARLSVAVLADGKLPSLEVVDWLAQEFGFEHGKLEVQVVPIAPGAGQGCVMLAQVLTDE